MATGRPLFPGGNTNDQLMHIFRILGTPSPQTWPGVVELPDWDDSFPVYPPKSLEKVVPGLTEQGYDLLNVCISLFFYLYISNIHIPIYRNVYNMILLNVLLLKQH